MSTPIPHGETTSQPPPVQQEYPPNPQQPPAPPQQPQRPPTVIQTGQSAEQQGALLAVLQDIGNKLSGLPESVVNSMRESMPQPPPPGGQAPPPQAQQQPPQQGQQPPGQNEPPAARGPNKFHSFWFGGNQ